MPCLTIIEPVGIWFDFTQNDDEVKVLFGIDEAAALLLQTGFRRPVIQLTLADKADLKSDVLDYHCKLKVKAPMDQYAEGLQQLKVQDLVQRFPLLAKQYFVAESKKVTAGQHIASFDCY